jgi:zinc transporter ZupT
MLFLVVIAGGLIAYFIKDLNPRLIHFLLSFSGAYLLSIIVFHILPDVYSVPDKKVGIFILLGILFQLFLEVFSHGAEHGHKQALINKTPWLVFISLSIHAFMEGLPINSGDHFHSSYFLAILVHKLPISIILTSLMISAGYSLKKILLLLVMFASMSPLAAWLGHELTILKEYEVYINAFVAGILTHVGTTILFENEHSHEFKIRKFLVIVLAMILAYLG